MKVRFTALFICFAHTFLGQTGKVNIDIIITDTVKPYFLDVYAHKGNILASKITVGANGSYLINNLAEGSYNFEFHSFESFGRRLIIENIKVFKDSTTTFKVTYPAPCRFIYPKGYKPICKYNHSDKIIKIVYGLPFKETMLKAKKGLIRLGGCEVTGCDPKYYCTVHDIEF